MIFDLALVSLGVASILWLLSPFLKYRFAQAAEARRLRSAYYRAAEKMLEKPDLPLIFAEMIVVMTKGIMSRHMLWSFTLHALSGRWVRPPVEMASRFRAELGKLPPNEQLEFLMLIGIFLVALTFNNPLLGVFWRRVLLVATPTDIPGNDLRHTEAVMTELGARTCAAA
jgi:hypothetical protein